jgi:hypothetical protein
VALSAALQPGENYVCLLERLHHWLRPTTYVEVGVGTGSSLALVGPGTVNIGIDPNPQLTVALPANARIYRLTSDEFFATHGVTELLGDSPVALGFIDGLHLFEQALKDLINLERQCARQSLLLIHDTFPIDALTSSRERKTTLWSGDTWKVMACLKEHRPDLRTFTVAARPTGLSFVTNLDPGSLVLSEAYDDIVAKFIDVDYRFFVDHQEGFCELVPSHWPLVRDRLESLGVSGFEDAR